MFISRKYIYLHLPKTGGQFIRAFLQNSGNMEWSHPAPKFWKHHRGAIDIPPKYNNRPIIGSIRNPFDWYVSWYEHYSVSNRRRGFYKIGNADFKTTLENIFFKRKDKLMNGIPRKTTADFFQMRKDDVGLMTHMFKNMFWLAGEEVGTQYMRLENFVLDIIRIMGLSPKHQLIINKMKPINITPGRKSYQEYYDDESRGWVEHKDKYLLEKFNYKFEEA